MLFDDAVFFRYIEHVSPKTLESGFRLGSLVGGEDFHYIKGGKLLTPIPLTYLTFNDY